jgi:hypothetical protein
MFLSQSIPRLPKRFENPGGCDAVSVERTVDFVSTVVPVLTAEFLRLRRERNSFIWHRRMQLNGIKSALSRCASIDAAVVPLLDSRSARYQTVRTAKLSEAWTKTRQLSEFCNSLAHYVDFS